MANYSPNKIVGYPAGQLLANAIAMLPVIMSYIFIIQVLGK